MPYRCEDEVRAIRDKLYEETKDLTGEEFDKYMRDESEQLVKEFGFTIIESVSHKMVSQNVV